MWTKRALIDSVVNGLSLEKDMPAKVRRTRQKSGELGAPANLPDVGQLPTNKEVIASIEAELEMLDTSGNQKHRAQKEDTAFEKNTEMSTQVSH